MKESLLIIPEQFLKTLNEKQDKIIELLNNQKDNDTSDYITEKQAREIFKRKATWFWQMRRDGILPFSKIGKSIFYSKNDIKKVMDDSRNEIGKTNKD